MSPSMWSSWPRDKTCISYVSCVCRRVLYLVAQTVKRLPTLWETRVRALGREDPLEKEMATHSSILAWNMPWTEESGRLQSMGSQRVGHDWATSLHFFTTSATWEAHLALGPLYSLGIWTRWSLLPFSCRVVWFCYFYSKNPLMWTHDHK